MDQKWIFPQKKCFIASCQKSTNMSTRRLLFQSFWPPPSNVTPSSPFLSHVKLLLHHCTTTSLIAFTTSNIWSSSTSQYWNVESFLVQHGSTIMCSIVKSQVTIKVLVFSPSQNQSKISKQNLLDFFFWFRAQKQVLLTCCYLHDFFYDGGLCICFDCILLE